MIIWPCYIVYVEMTLLGILHDEIISIDILHDEISLLDILHTNNFYRCIYLTDINTL